MALCIFSGITLDGGKRYTQIVEKSFHVSMAALEPVTKASEDNSGYISLMLAHEKCEFLLCSLQQEKIMQVPLDLNFTEGEEVTFFTTGNGKTTTACKARCHLYL